MDDFAGEGGDVDGGLLIGQRHARSSGEELHSAPSAASYSGNSSLSENHSSYAAAPVQSRILGERPTSLHGEGTNLGSGSVHRPAFGEVAQKSPAPGATNRSSNSESTRTPPDLIIQHRTNMLQMKTRKHFDWKCLFRLILKRSPVANVEQNSDADWTAEERFFSVSFAELQRMRLRKLQRELIHDTACMYITAKEHENSKWEKNLKEYVQAFRDYDYMSSVIASSEFDDPFIATSENEAVARSMIEVLNLEQVTNAQWPVPRQTRSGRHTLISEEVWKDVLSRTIDHFENIVLPIPPIGGTRRANIRATRASNLRLKLGMAMLGGLLLVGPMWLMVLHNTKYTALVSTSVFVFIFGLLAAWFFEKPLEVVAGTAAYAAVLVVFVGTNVDSGGDSN